MENVTYGMRLNEKYPSGVVGFNRNYMAFQMTRKITSVPVQMGDLLTFYISSMLVEYGGFVI